MWIYWDVLRFIGKLPLFLGIFDITTGYAIITWIVTHSQVEEIILKIQSLLEMIGHQRHALSLPESTTSSSSLYFPFIGNCWGMRHFWTERKIIAVATFHDIPIVLLF